MSDIDDVIRRHQELEHGHFVFTSGMHSDTYTNNRPLTNNATAMRIVVRALLINTMKSADLDESKPIIVLGPQTMGEKLATVMKDVGAELGLRIICLSLIKNANDLSFKKLSITSEILHSESQVIWVDDTLSTGSTLRKTQPLVTEHKASIAAVSVITNRSALVADELGIDNIVALQTVHAPTYDPGVCPLCLANMPINLSPGHGNKFREANPDYKGGFIE